MVFPFQPLAGFPRPPGQGPAQPALHPPVAGSSNQGRDLRPLPHRAPDSPQRRAAASLRSPRMGGPQELPAPAAVAPLAPDRRVAGLSNEIWLQIFEHADCNALQLVGLSHTCKQFWYVSHHNSLWYGTDADVAARNANPTGDATQLYRAANDRLNGLHQRNSGLLYHLKVIGTLGAKATEHPTFANRRWTTGARRQIDVAVMAARYGLMKWDELVRTDWSDPNNIAEIYPQRAVLERALRHASYNLFLDLPAALQQDPGVAALAAAYYPGNVRHMMPALRQAPATVRALFARADVWRVVQLLAVHAPQLLQTQVFGQALTQACVAGAGVGASPFDLGRQDNLVKLQSLPPALLQDFHVARRAVLWAPEVWPQLAPALRHDADFVRRVVGEGLSLTLLPPAQRDDSALACAAVRANPEAMQHIGDDSRNDLAVARALLAASPADAQPFCYFSPNLFNDRTFARMVMGRYPALMQGAGPVVRDDLDVAFTLLAADAWEALPQLTPRVRDDVRFVNAALAKSPLALRYLGPGARHNAALVTDCVRRDGMALQYAMPHLQAHEGVVATALRQNGAALAFADSTLQMNEGLNWLALRSNVEALPWVTPAVRGSASLLQHTNVAQMPHLWPHLSFALQSVLHRQAALDAPPVADPTGLRWPAYHGL